MGFIIGVLLVIVFLCGTIYFHHTVQYGQGRATKQTSGKGFCNRMTKH